MHKHPPTIPPGVIPWNSHRLISWCILYSLFCGLYPCLSQNLQTGQVWKYQGCRWANIHSRAAISKPIRQSWLEQLANRNSKRSYYRSVQFRWIGRPRLRIYLWFAAGSGRHKLSFHQEKYDESLALLRESKELLNMFYIDLHLDITKVEQALASP